MRNIPAGLGSPFRKFRLKTDFLISSEMFSTEDLNQGAAWTR